MKMSLEGLFVVVLKTRLDSKYFISADLRSAHELLYPSIQKIFHTLFHNLIPSPLVLPSYRLPLQPCQNLSGFQVPFIRPCSYCTLVRSLESNEPEEELRSQVQINGNIFRHQVSVRVMLQMNKRIFQLTIVRVGKNTL